MSLHECLVNMHMHTPYSDGAWYHADIAGAAMRAGLDMICVTDHNVWVQGPERYYDIAGKRVLVLVGEEVHDQARRPQKNHLLVYGAERELARHAARPQDLLDAANDAGGLTFLAHPFDTSVPLFNYEDISWVNWDLTGYTGMEIWNYMSDWARSLTSRREAIRNALHPELGVSGPSAKTLERWDALTAAGRRVVGIGNSDAHATVYSRWGLTRAIFPYEFMFCQVNTHILVETPLTGDHGADRRNLLQALVRGRCFVGYDGIEATRGFRFTASGEGGGATMGDEVFNQSGLTLDIVTPAPARLRLLCNGCEVGRWERQAQAAYSVAVDQPGAYRVEAYLPFKGRERGWIYSNPIYVRG